MIKNLMNITRGRKTGCLLSGLTMTIIFHPQYIFSMYASYQSMNIMSDQSFIS